MIDPKELRLGNIVTGSRGVRPVNGIRDNRIYFKDEEDMTVYTNDERVMPIPITPEWLEAFGFEKEKLKISGGTVYSIGNYMVIKSLGGAQYSGRYTFHHRFMAARFMREIEYIHQIQNIIHALTGSELTVKE